MDPRTDQGIAPSQRAIFGAQVRHRRLGAICPGVGVWLARFPVLTGRGFFFFQGFSVNRCEAWPANSTCHGDEFGRLAAFAAHPTQSFCRRLRSLKASLPRTRQSLPDSPPAAGPSCSFGLIEKARLGSDFSSDRACAENGFRGEVACPGWPAEDPRTPPIRLDLFRGACWAECRLRLAG